MHLRLRGPSQGGTQTLTKRLLLPPRGLQTLTITSQTLTTRTHGNPRAAGRRPITEVPRQCGVTSFSDETPTRGNGQGSTIYHILSKNSAMCPPSRAVVPLSSFNFDVARRRAPRHRQTFLQGRLPSRNPRSLGHGPIEGPQERPDRRKHVGRLRWSSGIISHGLAEVLADRAKLQRHGCQASSIQRIQRPP